MARYAAPSNVPIEPSLNRTSSTCESWATTFKILNAVGSLDPIQWFEALGFLPVFEQLRAVHLAPLRKDSGDLAGQLPFADFPRPDGNQGLEALIST